MSDLVRLSVSLDQPLLDKLGALVGEGNRSEFIRDLIRDRIVSEDWDQDVEALGTITLVYDHNQRQLSAKLTEVQHHHHGNVLATTHVHLDHDHCAEMIMVKGRASEIREIAQALQSQKGVLHTSLSMSSTGARLR